MWKYWKTHNISFWLCVVFFCSPVSLLLWCWHHHITTIYYEPPCDSHPASKVTFGFTSTPQVTQCPLSCPRPQSRHQGNGWKPAAGGETLSGGRLNILTGSCWMLSLFRYGTATAWGNASTWPPCTNTAECMMTVRSINFLEKSHISICFRSHLTGVCVYVCALVFQPTLAVCRGQSVRTNFCMWLRGAKTHQSKHKVKSLQVGR